jgi:hypothetical protein
MKKILQTILFAAAVVVIAASCKKQETKIYYEGGTPPVLAADRSSVTLNPASKNNTAVAFSWTNPNYNFTTGVSSQDVSYILQIDTAGANFTNPNKQEISVNKDLGVKLTVADLNGYLTKLALEPDLPHSLEVRIVASLKGSLPLASNVVKIDNVVPYEDFAIVPPASGELYIIGGATPDGWGNPVTANQKLTTVKKGLYEITLNLTGGQSYLFLPVNGSWAAKYGGLGANNTNNPNGDGFKPDGGDLLAPSVTGSYKVVVDFKTGRFTLTKQ